MKILGHRRCRVHRFEFHSPCAGRSEGYPIVNYDKLTYAGNLANLESVADNPNYSFVKGDICDAPAVEAAMPAAMQSFTSPPNLT